MHLYGELRILPSCHVELELFFGFKAEFYVYIKLIYILIPHILYPFIHHQTQTVSFGYGK